MTIDTEFHVLGISRSGNFARLTGEIEAAEILGGKIGLGRRGRGDEMYVAA